MTTLGSILGLGLVRPLRRGASDFVAADGEDRVKSLVGQVLGTRGGTEYATGELPWRSSFGSLLHLLRHRQNNATTAELARVYVAEALAKWLPFIRLKSVTTEAKPADAGEEPNVLLIRIVYDVLGSRSGAVILTDVSQTIAIRAA